MSDIWANYEVTKYLDFCRENPTECLVRFLFTVQVTMLLYASVIMLVSCCLKRSERKYVVLKRDAYNRLLISSIPSSDSDDDAPEWKPIGFFIKEDVNTELYERVYPSGKKAWRYADAKDGRWIYPSQTAVLLHGFTHDKVTSLLAERCSSAKAVSLVEAAIANRSGTFNGWKFASHPIDDYTVLAFFNTTNTVKITGMSDGVVHVTNKVLFNYNGETFTPLSQRQYSPWTNTAYKYPTITNASDFRKVITALTGDDDTPYFVDADNKRFVMQTSTYLLTFEGDNFTIANKNDDTDSSSSSDDDTDSSYSSSSSSSDDDTDSSSDDDTDSSSDGHVWKSIGMYKSGTNMYPLYERVYESGKKSWRYNTGDKWVYPSYTLTSKNACSKPLIITRTV